MALSRLGIVILAAGKGLRMASSQPKVLHQVAGRAMLLHVLAAVAPLEAARVVVVVGPGMDDVKAAAEPHDSVVQEEQLGTGHAVLAAREKLGAEALDEVRGVEQHDLPRRKHTRPARAAATVDQRHGARVGNREVGDDERDVRVRRVGAGAGDPGE